MATLQVSSNSSASDLHLAGPRFDSLSVHRLSSGRSIGQAVCRLLFTATTPVLHQVSLWWCLWWREWDWYRFLFEYFCFLLSVSLQQSSVLILFSMAHSTLYSIAIHDVVTYALKASRHFSICGGKYCHIRLKLGDLRPFQHSLQTINDCHPVIRRRVMSY